LSNVHPEPFQSEAEQFLVFGHQREHFPFDGSRFHWNPLDHVYIQNVESSVDFVRYILLRFFNEVFHLAVLGMQDHSILGRVIDSSE